MIHNYGFNRTLEMPYADAVHTVTQILEREGFRRVTQTDLSRTLQDNTEDDAKPHIVMGFCNPKLAKQMLSIRPELGLLALSSVTVYDTGNGTSTLCIDDPVQTLGAAKMLELQPIVEELNRKLWRAYLQTIVAAVSYNGL